MTDAPMTVAEWLALPKAARRSAWGNWSVEQRSAMFGLFAATTPGFALPYPTDYNDPADSPTALRELATATDNALGLMSRSATAEANYVKNPTSVLITDWNAATLSGFYRCATGASNCPATDLGNTAWFGMVVRGNTVDYVQQILWPQTSNMYPQGTIMTRTKTANVWSGWERLGDNFNAWGGYDNFVTLTHNAPEYKRFAMGYHKATESNAPHALDEWRLQCYDVSGNFSWSAIKVPESGVVSMPKGHSSTTRALREGTELSADTAATLGAVVEIVRAMLAGVAPALAEPEEPQ